MARAQTPVSTPPACDRTRALSLVEEQIAEAQPCREERCMRQAVRQSRQRRYADSADVELTLILELRYGTICTNLILYARSTNSRRVSSLE